MLVIALILDFLPQPKKLVCFSRKARLLLLKSPPAFTQKQAGFLNH
jgi:hypothetical protein